MSLTSIFKPSRWLNMAVFFPMLLAILYYLFIASDRYVSESVISVRQAGESSSGISGLALLAGINPSSREDTLYLREYIHSLDMLKTLDEKIHLRSLFETQKVDLLYRLYSFMPQELYLGYFKNRVEIVYDDLTGLLKVRAEGFTPEDAQKLSSAILAQSEIFVNELSYKMSRQQLSFAEQELFKAKERFSKAKSALLAFQNHYGVLDPMSQAQSWANLAIEFDAMLSKKETELSAMLAYLQESAPQVVTLKSEIGALKKQLLKEQKRIATDSSSSLNALASQYQNIAIEVGFAEDIYKLTLQTVEKARMETSRQVKYLAIIQNPLQPQMAEYPRRIYNLITIFIVLMLLYGISRLIKATIEDHTY
ncbi:MAG: capsule biosynthesis protein [Campylobacteraceae bacterium]|nr:capsule biosynthesis protein [Campylobacteraceae bacterium]